MLLGPNDLHLFQLLDASASVQPPLSDLTLKLVLFYNAKVGVASCKLVKTVLRKPRRRKFANGIRNLGLRNTGKIGNLPTSGIQNPAEIYNLTDFSKHYNVFA